MEITRKVHLLEGTKGSYSYLVLGQEPVLVDTSMPGRADKIVNALAALGMQPTDLAHIVLTHQDADHIGNAKHLKELSGAALWAPKEEVPYIHGDIKGRGIRRIIGSLMKVDRPRVDKVLEAGQHVGDLELIPAPGHTPGHVCLRVDDVLLAGDLLPPAAADSNHRQVSSPGIRQLCLTPSNPLANSSLTGSVQPTVIRSSAAPCGKRSSANRQVLYASARRIGAHSRAMLIANLVRR